MNQFFKQSVGITLSNSAKIYCALFLFSLVYASNGLATNYVPNTFADPTITTLNNATGAIDGGATISLRSALMAADNTGGTHTITLATGTYLLDGAGTYTVPSLGTFSSRTIFLGNTTQNITITGNGPANTIISMAAAGADRVFAINYDGVVDDIFTTFSGVKIQNGLLNFDQYGGAAIYAGPVGGNDQTLTITNCTFDNNICPNAAGNGGTGGAVYMFQAILNIDNSTFTNNKSIDGDGGAVIYILYNNQGNSGDVNITNSSFSGNTAGGNGGAVLVTSQGAQPGGITFTANINKNTFSGNTATGFGGGLTLNNGANLSVLQAHYNRFVNNISTASPSSSGLHFVESDGSVNAENNWWGCNINPVNAVSTAPCNQAGGDVAGGGSLDTNPWLQLKTSASPATICNTAASIPTNTSLVTTSFLSNSANTAIPVANLSAVIGLGVTWTATLGTTGAPQFLTIQANGTASTTFTSNGTGGTATVNAVVDNVPAAETTPARASITVNTASEPPTGASGSLTICNGATTLLTVTGGLKGTGAVTEWFTGPCGTGLVHTGDTYTTPNITSTTNYFVRYTGTCNTTACLMVTVNVLPPINYGSIVVSSANHLVISQVYGGGGNGSAPFTHDFVEIFNPTGAAVNVAGWSIQYQTQAASSWANLGSLTGTINPGEYYLIQLASGGGVGSPLPIADLIGASTNISATQGKIALVNSTTVLTTCVDASIIDKVGYGTTSVVCNESANTAAPSATASIQRANGGCTDTDNNSTDFSTGPPNPRNSASTANICPGASTETICSGSIPSPMSVSGASGGAGTFTYQWYYQQPPVPLTCPSGNSVVGWNPLTIAEGTGFNTATFTPTLPVTADITYAATRDTDRSACLRSANVGYRMPPGNSK